MMRRTGYVYFDHQKQTWTARITFTDEFGKRRNVRNGVHAIDPHAGLYNIATLEQIVAYSVSQPRLYAMLLGINARAICDSSCVYVIEPFDIYSYASQDTPSAGAALN